MKYTYPALFAKQSEQRTVFSFCAEAKDILAFSAIDRIGRSKDGGLKGFQRPQVVSHIKEIKQYLSTDDAVLPNSVVIAFTSGVEVIRDLDAGIGKVVITMEGQPPGLVVDGQQRLSSLSELADKEFEVFVTGLICEDDEELRKQFILINNTKPLPKPLIYELLPTVTGLPSRLSARSKAASLVELLNYSEGSSLKGLIKQQTNPTGVIQDTVMQKLIMTSLSDGALRECYESGSGGDQRAFTLLSEFFAAVQETFPTAWEGHKPRTSRLVHGAGLVSMGYVMEHLYFTESARRKADFISGLGCLEGNTAWTEGAWEYSSDNIRPWNSIQFVPRDYMDLSQHLLKIVRADQRSRQRKKSVKTKSAGQEA